MNLLAPLLLIGAVGLAIPVIAHLLGNERPQIVRFGGARFLREQEPRVTQRRRIHDLPLMLVRLALLAGLVLALARPATVGESRIAVVAEPHDAMLLIDASASMELRVDGRSEREHALEASEQILEALPPGSRSALVTSDPRGPRVELGDVHARISAVLEGWPSEGHGWRRGAWPLSDGLREAAIGLGAARGDRPRVIYAIGDATERGIGSLPAMTEGGIRVVPVSTAGGPTSEETGDSEHVGIESVTWEHAPDLDPRAVRVRAVITRRGGAFEADPDEDQHDQQAEEVEVTAALQISGDEVARASVQLSPGEQSAVEFTHNLSPEQVGGSSTDRAAATAATIELLGMEDDPLPIDDRRHLWLSAGGAVSALVVNGDPSEQRANDEVFFMTTALSSARNTQFDVRGLAPDQLDERVKDHGSAALAEVDLLLLANVRAPLPDTVQAIRSRVEEGMGLMISVGDRVVPADYNERFGDALPLPLRGASYAGTAPGRKDARSEGIAPAQLSHPMFAGLDEDLDLSATRTRRMMLLEPDPRQPSEIAVAFTNGAPALITRQLKRGRVALLTTTLDRDWGDLPLRPGFVRLIDHVVTWLAGARAGAGALHVFVGEPRLLPPGVPYLVHTPDGRSLPLAPAEEGETTRFEDTDQPGHYRAEAREGKAGSQITHFVVEVDPRESDTAVAAGDPAAADDRESSGRAVPVHEPRWREVLWLCVVLVALETGLRLYRSRQGARKT
jgi:hypothetical protein